MSCKYYRGYVEPAGVEAIVDFEKEMGGQPLVVPYLIEISREQ